MTRLSDKNSHPFLKFVMGMSIESTVNKNIKVSYFKSIEKIQKKEGWSDCTVSNSKFSSVTLKARESIRKF